MERFTKAVLIGIVGIIVAGGSIKIYVNDPPQVTLDPGGSGGGIGDTNPTPTPVPTPTQTNG
ncbi:MAG TPA: hypothetical protein DEF47_02005 [Herpetosiphon sp.]|uniref:hypothetical protein n=1 Tax=Herpetosiphon sp. TaxID=71864 RepID=UPI00030B4E35|nr:hypothetical protein [Herpetosiphon sp.]HBW48660.1 hypothetical protein [Herpetosiphon sp.]